MTTVDDLPIVLPFSSPDVCLANAGGKGLNLARLSRAGFPVPAGFILTTRAYDQFVEANQLAPKILSTLKGTPATDPISLQAASAIIRALFARACIPPRLSAEIERAYKAMGSPAVAVRSSATAEDLPGLSFAGQQDTFLNIQTPAALLKAVLDCWSSLWTPRAIGYRARSHIPPDGLSLAVVVQAMVNSEVSGVMFTANPLSGLRSEVVIDAAFGLGEALVSGQVEPDHYVVNSGQMQINKMLGAKKIAVRSQPGGGVESFQQETAHLQALADEQIRALAQLGKQVESEYAFPQDIEWAFADGKLHLLQSRPITSLFPLPDGMTPEPLKVLLSFGAIQGMLDPFTPLGRDNMQMIFAMGAGMFGFQRTTQSQTALRSAGERLWIDFTPVVRNSVGRTAMHTALPMVEPTIFQALESIWDDPRLQPARKGFRLPGLFHLARFFAPLAANVVLNLLNPKARCRMILNRSEAILENTRATSAAIEGDMHSKLAKRAALLPDQIPDMLLLFISGIAAGMASFNIMRLASGAGSKTDSRAAGWSDLVLEVTRGVPHNPTTQMDLALWDTARAIQEDAHSLSRFREESPQELASAFLSGALPPAAQQAVARFMFTYGARGLAEIDMGRQRWREDPTHIMQVLGSFLQIEDKDMAPDTVFQRSTLKGEQAAQKLVEQTRQIRGGWIRSAVVRFAASRARALLGIRESPKFFAVRLMGESRRGLMESGRELVDAGLLNEMDDLFFLTFAEIQALANREQRDWKALVAARRAAYELEKQRRQVPRLLLSDGRAFFEGIQAQETSQNGFVGSPVSPGVAEGRVHVLLDPRGAQLQPGEILVCPGTDPSWTPLFLAAGGLIMEVGGMMTHGAVVAREYGIPAIVGVNQATIRLKTGQKIKMDGTRGIIEVIE